VATETRKHHQKKQKFDSDRKQALDAEWKSNSDESKKTSQSLRSSSRINSTNNTPLSSIDENTDTSVISPKNTKRKALSLQTYSSNASGKDEASVFLDTVTAHSVSPHMTRSKSRSFTSESSMSCPESDLPFGVTTRKKKKKLQDTI
jgi:hypothetical protein